MWNFCSLGSNCRVIRSSSDLLLSTVKRESTPMFVQISSQVQEIELGSLLRMPDTRVPAFSFTIAELAFQMFYNGCLFDKVWQKKEVFYHFFLSSKGTKVKCNRLSLICQQRLCQKPPPPEGHMRERERGRERERERERFCTQLTATNVDVCWLDA